MSGGASVTVEPPSAGAPPAGRSAEWRKYLVSLGFLLPALIFLGVWIVYPTVRTVIRSFYDRARLGTGLELRSLWEPTEPDSHERLSAYHHLVGRYGNESREHVDLRPGR